MKPSSFFVANFSEGEEDSRREGWTYPEHQKYRLSWMEDAARQAGLTCTPIDWFHPSSPGMRWLMLARSENLSRAQELATASNVGALQQQISVLKKRINELEKLERHPYVRFGSWVKRALQGRS
jgi:signal recognition particle subunit SEC65